MNPDDYPKHETVKEWVHEGHQCKITKMQMVPPGYYEDVGFTTMRDYHYCGYVRTTLSGTYTDYESEIDVHGGVTYGIDDEGWIGFDAGHAGDGPGGERGSKAIDVDGYLTKQTENLVEQIDAIENAEA